MEHLVKLIEPLKIRFKFARDAAPEFDSIAEFEKQLQRKSDNFQAQFDKVTAQLAEESHMLSVILKIAKTQKAQMKAKFGHELDFGLREFEDAKEQYNEALKLARAAIDESYGTVSKQLADTTAQFEIISAHNPLGEIRKSYLTVLNRLEGEKAFYERLLQRIAQIQDAVVQIAPLKKLKIQSTFSFEEEAIKVVQGIPKRVASSNITRVLRSTSVTDLVVPRQLVETTDGESGPAIVTPFSRGNSVVNLSLAAAEPSQRSPVGSVDSDETAAPPLPNKQVAEQAQKEKNRASIFFGRSTSALSLK